MYMVKSSPSVIYKKNLIVVFSQQILKNSEMLKPAIFMLILCSVSYQYFVSQRLRRNDFSPSATGKDLVYFTSCIQQVCAISCQHISYYIHCQSISCKYCIAFYCMYILLIWRKSSSTNRSLIKAK